MQKWKWVVLVTVFALAGLIVALFCLARHQLRGRIATEADASVAMQALNSAAPNSTQWVTHPPPEPREASSGSDSHSAPPLPATAPNDVVFGAILLTFEGAQGAPAKARSKPLALEMAKRLVPIAVGNFDEAAKQGDQGSTANAGSIRRGILEPSVEYVLFTLEKGTVCPEPIETPRGYWIMRRIR
jgi:hypothetical protein